MEGRIRCPGKDLVVMLTPISSTSMKRARLDGVRQIKAATMPVREQALRELLAWAVPSLAKTQAANEQFDGEEAVEGPPWHDPQAYMQSWIGAWLSETRASLVAEAERSSSPSETVVIEFDANRAGTFCSAICDGLRTAGEFDVVELCGSSWRVLAMVVTASRRGRPTRLTLAKARVAELSLPSEVRVEKVAARVVQSLTPAMRELDAIVGFAKLPLSLRQALLQQSESFVDPAPGSADSEAGRDATADAALVAALGARLSEKCGPGLAAHVCAHTNASQLEAIVAAAAPFERPAGRFLLIKGPPGTGKTSTTALALNAVHVKQFNRYYEAVRRAASAGEAPVSGGASSSVARLVAGETSDEPESWLSRLREARPRVLVCAPSNVAVDNVVAKIVEGGFVGGDGSKYRPDVVRVGRAAAGAASLDARVDELLTEPRTALQEHKERAEREAKRCARAADAARKRLRLFTASSPPWLPIGWEARVEPLRPHNEGPDKPFVYYVDHAAKLTSREAPCVSPGDDTNPLERCSPEFDVVLSDLHRHLEAWTRARGRAQACACALARYDAFTPGDVIRRQLAARLLDDAEIVCATLHGSGHQSVKDARRFKCVVVDEAANALETAILVPLASLDQDACADSNTASVVLVGDPQQLAATRKARRNAWAGASLFERLEPVAKCILLNTQYRMHPGISKFASDTFYKGKLKDGQAALNTTTDPRFRWREKAPAFAPLAFLDLATSAEEATHSSRANRPEARLAAAAYATLLNRFDASKQRLPSVALVAFYREQLTELERALRLACPDLPQPEINTVDAFQGREKDVVIVSCVRADADGVGFLKDARRLNVALTRAKYVCLVIGRKPTLMTDPLWRRLLDYAQRSNALFAVPHPEADLLRLRPATSPDQHDYSPSHARDRDDFIEDGQVVGGHATPGSALSQAAPGAGKLLQVQAPNSHDAIVSSSKVRPHISHLL